MGTELKIRGFELVGNGLEAYYFERDEVRVMAIDPEADPERRRLWELVAYGMRHVPQTTRRLIGNAHPDTTGFYFFGPHKSRGGAPLAVNAAAKVIVDLEPEWVSAIAAARLVADDPRVIAAWSEVPIEAVLAALENWRARL